jgi:hypothetical protein
MPRTNINYSNTIIYKLCCKDLSITEAYVGHTTDMRKRKSNHKSRCNNIKDKKYNLNVYKFIRDNGGWDNWDMIEIERFEAIDGNDAKKRERYYIEELKATLNSEIPIRTQKEREEYYINYSKKYHIIHKEEQAEKALKYYHSNRDIINEKRNKNIKEKITCECGCEICKGYLLRHKQSKKHIDLMSYDK